VSAHRQHYFEANFRPESELGAESRTGRTLAIALLVISLLSTVTAIHFRATASSEPVVTPVRSPVVEHYELPPIEVDEARIEGFRAGYATAIQQGCTVRLTNPIGAK
jgi:hypothetical protein